MVHNFENDKTVKYLSESCQYNSSVLTLCGCNVSCRRFDVKKGTTGLRVYPQHVRMWHMKKKDPMLVLILL
jgi:hypothetical protein